MRDFKNQQDTKKKEIGWQIENGLNIRKLEPITKDQLYKPNNFNLEAKTHFYKILAVVDINQNHVISGMYQMLPGHPGFNSINASYWDRLEKRDLLRLEKKLGYR